jgi:hypothetical protein
MTLRYFLSVGAVLVCTVGCGGAGRALRSESLPPLIAYARPLSDVPASPAARREVVITVERISEDTLRDPMKVVDLRQWIVRQIVLQARNIPEERYQRLVRPRLAHHLEASGLTRADVGHILQNVDYVRSR